jgi:hypothetical protein
MVGRSGRNYDWAQGENLTGRQIECSPPERSRCNRATSERRAKSRRVWGVKERRERFHAPILAHVRRGQFDALRASCYLCKGLINWRLPRCEPIEQPRETVARSRSRVAGCYKAIAGLRNFECRTVTKRWRSCAIAWKRRAIRSAGRYKAAGGSHNRLDASRKSIGRALQSGRRVAQSRRRVAQTPGRIAQSTRSSCAKAWELAQPARNSEPAARIIANRAGTQAG